MKQFRHISVAETRQLIADRDVALVDVRDPMSYQSGHIEGAVALDNNTVEQFMASTPRQQPVVVYCYHGHSSQGAAQFLAERGFTEVYSMDGGYAAWEQPD